MRAITLQEGDRFELSERGDWLAIIRKDGDAEAWNTRTGALIARLGRFDPQGARLSYSADETLLVIEDWSSRQLWNLLTHVHLADLGPAGISQSEAAFSPDDRFVAFARMNDAMEPHTVLWNIADGNVVADLGIFASADFVTLSGRRVAVVKWAWQRERGSTIWDVERGELILACDGDLYGRIAIARDGEDARLLIRRWQSPQSMWRVARARN